MFASRAALRDQEGAAWRRMTWTASARSIRSRQPHAAMLPARWAKLRRRSATATAFEGGCTHMRSERSALSLRCCCSELVAYPSRTPA